MRLCYSRRCHNHAKEVADEHDVFATHGQERKIARVTRCGCKHLGMIWRHSRGGELECFVEKWGLKGKVSELGIDQLAVEEIEYGVEMEGEVKVE